LKTYLMLPHGIVQIDTAKKTAAREEAKAIRMRRMIARKDEYTWNGSTGSANLQAVGS
jgi:hypothetical protein